jgi:hypothetical protein
VDDADRDRGGERRRRMTGRERGRRREQTDRVDRRVGERRTRPVERLLQQHHREPGGRDRAARRDAGPRQQAPPGPVEGGADDRDQRPLHPPRRGEQEHRGERRPADALAERRHGDVQGVDPVEERDHRRGTVAELKHFAGDPIPGVCGTRGACRSGTSSSSPHELALAWSPSGESLAWVGRLDNGGIYVTRLADGATRRLTRGEWDLAPDWRG